MELNYMQGVASREFQYWFKHPESRYRRWFEISGPAGSGKTTVVKHIMAGLGLRDDDVMFMAFVGKAALALRLSGVNGRTIHSVIYKVIEEPERDENGNLMYENGAMKTKTRMIKVNDIPNNIKLLVVDEGGMVDSKIGRDILSFKIPTLVLGDLNQLPPVFGESLFLKKPDVILNEIMRQHKDSPIIYLSQLATHGIMISYGTYGTGNDECRVIRKKDLKDEDLINADLVICSTNRTRDIINWYMRKNIYGIDAPFVVPGDRLICRQNCWNIILDDPNLDIPIALVNGMIGNVTSTVRGCFGKDIDMNIDFKPEFSNEVFMNIPISSSYVLNSYEKRKGVSGKFEQYKMFELGYCSTCHLAQGSQYPHVIVYLDSPPSTSAYFCKWLYTAITRARMKVTIVM